MVTEQYSASSDFQRQYVQLQKEMEATGNLVIFHLKFHFELNFIERYFSLFLLYTFPQPNWTLGKFCYAAKYYGRENCDYDLKSLRETVPKVLDSVTVFASFHYYRQSAQNWNTGLSSSRKRSIAVIDKPTSKRWPSSGQLRLIGGGVNYLVLDVFYM